MFEASHPFAFFDYFRVPYWQMRTFTGGLPEHLGRLGPAAPNGRSLIWLRGDPEVRATPARVLGRFRLGGMPVVGHVLIDPPQSVLTGMDSEWHPRDAIIDERGRTVASVWVDESGSVFLPFDPGEVMHNLWSERYATIGTVALGRRMRGALVRCYYAVRPLLPRRLQLWLRRRFARRQRIPAFPAWPIEHGLHDMYDWLFGLVTEIAQAPVPWLAPWPDGTSWAMVLTHDVETAVGLADVDLLRTPERELGYRSSWNLVGERYPVDAPTVQRLQAEGCEIGVHGLRHDGRDLASARLLARRLPAMRAHAAEWRSIGFRSPATQRSWELMPRLGFTYDSSYTDTDPYEPQPGGCCTYLPFCNGDLVELPITLPQDHTLFEILQRPDGRLWIEKAHEIRERGGLVLVLAHPDYARDARLATAWQKLLAEFAGDDSAWLALPREVATWWRHRAASQIVREDGRWRIDGPAAIGGRVLFTKLASSGTRPWTEGAEQWLRQS
jgi:hypothetical protein